MGFFLNELFTSSNVHVCYFQTIFAIHHILSKPFFTISRTHKFPKKVEEKEGKGLQKALKILDFITPKTTRTQVCRNHLRLIQACMQDLVESDQNQQWGSSNCISASSTEISQDMFVEILERDISWTSLYFRMHKEGIVKANEGTLSSALSSCGSVRAVESGIQLHCLGIKTGFDLFVYVGSSLINFYSKCGDLENAYKVFEEMPVRNVVSWTAIISGFAQQLEVEMCLKLYDRMRRSTSKPNDFTLCSILSACTGSGSLGQGRSAHCQTIQMGFNSNTHISNALISMYSKCGNVEEAFYIFEKIQRRDLISWNSMIAGYAQHGLAKKAINLFKEMEKHKIEPDGITFLGVLSSCRHAGFIEQGWVYFNSMSELGVEPDLDHYSCIVDLLGRSGLLKEAREFILKMPICPNEVIWGSLLASCRLHGNVWIGIEAAESRLLLDLSCAATHVQLANLYASAGYWDEAARVRKLMKDRGLKTNPGYSWIEIRNEVYKFRVEDRSNAVMDEIFNVVDGLVDNMRDFGYVPKIQEEAVDL